jgi:hypothetical protein
VIFFLFIIHKGVGQRERAAAVASGRTNNHITHDKNKRFDPRVSTPKLVHERRDTDRAMRREIWKKKKKPSGNALFSPRSSTVSSSVWKKSENKTSKV